jgi:hypothetical protein
VSFDLGLKGYSEERMRQFDASLPTKTSSIPGITSAGIINALPLHLEGGDTEFIWRAERPLPKPSERRLAFLYNISPGYLRTAGTTLIAGRDIDSHDRHGSRSVAIINQAFARVLFGDENPLGKQVRVSSISGGIEIVGLVETGKYGSLGEDPRPAVFVPMVQAVNRWTTLVVRSPLPAQYVTALLRKKCSTLIAKSRCLT